MGQNDRPGTVGWLRGGHGKRWWTDYEPPGPRTRARAARTDQQSVNERMKVVEQKLKAALAETRAKETELAKKTELICELRALIRDYEKRDITVNS